MSEAIASRPRLSLGRRGALALALLPVVALVVLMAIPAVPMNHGSPARAPVAVAFASTSVGTGSWAAPAANLIVPSLSHLLTNPVGFTTHTLLPNSPYVGERIPVPPLVGPSTAANFWLNGSDCTGFGEFTPFEPLPIGGVSVTSVGTSNTTLVAAASSIQGVFNTTGGVECTTINIPSPFYASHGNVVLFRSTDSGHSWTPNWLGQNKTHWLNLGDSTNGTYNWGQPTIASDASGNLLVAEIAIPNCWFNFTNFPAAQCTFSANPNASIQEPWTIAVAHSFNGGLGWSDPVQVATLPTWAWVNTGPACQSIAPSQNLPVAIPEHPQLAVNPVNGVAIVTWSNLTTTWDSTTCTLLVNTISVEYSRSTDNGLTWSPARPLATLVAGYPAVAIGPAPTYAITVSYDDASSANASAGATSFGAVRSIDNGSTWTRPTDIAKGEVNIIFGLNPSYATVQNEISLPWPTIAADTSPSSAYKGHEYIVWSDNGTGSSAGQPAIDAIVSTDSGASWSLPMTLATPGRNGADFQPSVAVDPNGMVWVTFYGYNSAGVYGFYSVTSTNGGSTWSPAFQVTDTLSTPPTGLVDVGAYTSVAATTNGAFPVWTDCRQTTCSTNFDTQYWTANPHIVTISAVGPTLVNATVSTGTSQIVAALPTSLGWDNSSTHTVSVPQYLPDTSNTSAVWGFQSWSGATTSTNTQVTLTYSGGSANLVANYAELPAAILRGYFSPNVVAASLKLLPQGGGTPVAIPLLAYNASAYQYSTSVAGGLQYTLNATAPQYAPSQVTIPTSGSGGVYWHNFSLAKASGTITGQLIPSTAVLTVDDIPQTVNPSTGLFSVAVPWGLYWVNASLTGYTGFSEQVNVVAGTSQHVPVGTTSPIQLFGGNISGVVNVVKSGLVVKVDGNPVNVSLAGTFGVQVPGGFHTLTATAPGYNLTSMQDIPVIAGQTTIVNVTLTNKGWISGLVGPTTAATIAALHIYSPGGSGNFYKIASDGSFNVSLSGGASYIVNVTATGYASYQSSAINVTPGNGSSLSITLNKSVVPPPTCEQLGTCPPPPQNQTSQNNGIPLTTVLIIVVVIVLVAIVAAVLLMRRRGGGGGEEEQPTYAESDPSQLPKMQADGSWGPPPPPQS